MHLIIKNQRDRLMKNCLIETPLTCKTQNEFATVRCCSRHTREVLHRSDSADRYYRCSVNIVPTGPVHLKLPYNIMTCSACPSCVTWCVYAGPSLAGLAWHGMEVCKYRSMLINKIRNGDLNLIILSVKY